MKVLITTFHIAFTMALVFDNSYARADGHTELLKALSTPPFKVAQSVFFEMREVAPLEAAQIYFETLAFDPSYVLGISDNLNLDNVNRQQCPPFSPVSVANLLKAAIKNIDRWATLHNPTKRYVDLLPWDIADEDKVAFLDELATLYIENQGLKYNFADGICVYEFGFLVSK